MIPTTSLFALLDTQYANQKRLVQLSQTLTETFLPKLPTPAEVFDSSIELNKTWSKMVQDELATLTKSFYNFK